MARAILLPAALLGLVLLAAPAHAVYVMTPLRMTPVDSEGDVGDDLAFSVDPDPESNRSYAGATLTLRYVWNANEGSESAAPDERSGTGPAVTLDAKGHATFTWTIPAEVDDRNVGLSLVDDAGEGVAFAYVRVGDAQPQMRTMVGGAGSPIDGGEHATTPTPTGTADESAAKDVPGFAALAALGLLAAVALVLRRR